MLDEVLGLSDGVPRQEALLGLQDHPGHDLQPGGCGERRGELTIPGSQQSCRHLCCPGLYWHSEDETPVGQPVLHLEHLVVHLHLHHQVVRAVDLVVLLVQDGDGDGDLRALHHSPALVRQTIKLEGGGQDHPQLRGRSLHHLAGADVPVQQLHQADPQLAAGSEAS